MPESGTFEPMLGRAENTRLAWSAPASRLVDSDDDHSSETVATDAHSATEASGSETLPSSRTAEGTIAHRTPADLTGRFVGGRVIAGRYTLREVLGKRGMGTVSLGGCFDVASHINFASRRIC